MKQKKILAAGFAIGLVFSMSIQAFAAPVIEKIEAYINHQMTFTFNGEKKALPEGYEVIVYKDHSYVPARFVAENLGAEVTWNDQTKEIGIVSKKSDNNSAANPSDSNSATNPNDSKATAPKYDYKKLPLYKETANYKMSVVLFSDDNQGKKLNITLENKSDDLIQLDQMATIVEADGKSYDMSKATITHLDTRWYQDLKKEDKTEGFIRLPNNIDYTEVKNIHAVFKVKSNGALKEWTENMDFDIAL